jgi:hypothetical protein
LYWIIVRWYILTMTYASTVLWTISGVQHKHGFCTNITVFETASTWTSLWNLLVSTYCKVHYSLWAEDYFAHTSFRGCITNRFKTPSGTIHSRFHIFA